MTSASLDVYIRCVYLPWSGPTTSRHSHPPSQDAVKAQIIVEEMKTVAESQPGLLPSVILRDALATATPRVISQLPPRENMRQTICRERRKKLPPNPTSLEDLEDLPDECTKTSLGEQSVLHDNYDTQQGDGGRVIVFATRKNIEVLCRSPTWFVDGIFKVSPSLFTQLFTIIGVRQRNTPCGEDTPLPLVYALLEGKHESEYVRVLEAVRDAVALYRINACIPARIMADFELAILNACEKVYPAAKATGCFFHLGQSVYGQIQAIGLQQRYNDEEDDTIRTYSHMLMALAYVPTAEVPRTFQQLHDDLPAELDELFKYFDRVYVRGVPARGRRRCSPASI